MVFKIDMSKSVNHPFEFKPEPLNPELFRSIRSGPLGIPGVFHPLVYEPLYDSTFNCILNERLKFKQRLLAESFGKKDFVRYIFTYERPHRLESFLDINAKLRDKSYWNVLGMIYVD